MQIALCSRVVTRCATVFLFLLLCQTVVWADVDPEQAVTHGAGALDSWWDYPWYDDQTDDIRRIEVKSRPQPPPQSTGTSTRAAWDLAWLGWLLLGLVVLGILIMLARVYRNRSRDTGAAGKADVVGSPSSVDRLEELPFVLEQPAGDLLSAARQAADQGDYDRAIILLYSYQLLQLDRRDAIRLTKGKTNRQYLGELRHRPGLAPLLSTSMVAFEDVFFGGHSLGRERFEECWGHAMQLLAADEAREAA